MILTLREQAVIKEWNKKGMAGLRVSSLLLLENIKGIAGVENSDISKMLVRHTMRTLPQSLWGDSEKICKEICFVAGVDFDEEVYFLRLCQDEKEEREDEEFDSNS